MSFLRPFNPARLFNPIRPRLSAILSTIILGLTLMLGYKLIGEAWSLRNWLMGLGVLLFLNLCREFYDLERYKGQSIDDLVKEGVKTCGMTVEGYIEAMAPQDFTVRAYIMLYDHNELRVKHDYNMRDTSELQQLHLKSGQGIQGQAFALNRGSCGPYDPTIPPSDPRSLGLTLELREFLESKDIKWRWAWPLATGAEAEIPIGVLYVDTTASLIYEQGERVNDIVRTHASVLSRAYMIME